jgi:predicted  nucleic acid-binding Zn-ribbon protein
VVEDTIRQIEQAQRRIREAQESLKQAIQRQQARLENNRRVIDEASEHTHP